MSHDGLKNRFAKYIKGSGRLHDCEPENEMKNSGRCRICKVYFDSSDIQVTTRS